MSTQSNHHWLIALPTSVLLAVLGVVLFLPDTYKPIEDEHVYTFQGNLRSICDIRGGGECANGFDIYLDHQPIGGRLVIDGPVFPYFDADAFIHDVHPGTLLTITVLRCTGTSTESAKYIVDIRTATKVYLSRETVNRRVGRWRINPDLEDLCFPQER